jgi:hypothetical protein
MDLALGVDSEAKEAAKPPPPSFKACKRVVPDEPDADEPVAGAGAGAGGAGGGFPALLEGHEAVVPTDMVSAAGASGGAGTSAVVTGLDSLHEAGTVGSTNGRYVAFGFPLSRGSKKPDVRALFLFLPPLSYSELLVQELFPRPPPHPHAAPTWGSLVLFLNPCENAMAYGLVEVRRVAGLGSFCEELENVTSPSFAAGCALPSFLHTSRVMYATLTDVLEKIEGISSRYGKLACKVFQGCAARWFDLWAGLLVVCVCVCVCW